MFRLAIAFITFTTFFALAYTAEATITVLPKVIDVTTEARDVQTREITIINNLSHRVYVYPMVNEIAVDENGDIKEFRGPQMVDRKQAITSWLEIQRGRVDLMPGASTTIPLTIRMNPNTVPGEYHALLGFGQGRTSEDARRMVDNGTAPTIVVTVRVPDTSVEFVDLKGFTIDTYVTNADNSAISYILDNPGDLPVVPHGEVIIYDGGGKEIASVDANPDKITLQPGERVELTAAVPTEGMIGRYKGFLNVRYGSGQTAAVYDTDFFYVIPWQKILVVFGIVLVFTIGLTLYLYNRFELGERDDGSESVPMHLVTGLSLDQQHDLNLKTQRSEHNE